MADQGLNSEEEAEKCRSERRKMLPIITRISHVKLDKQVQFSKCELRKANLQPEASTGHTSPFKPNGERTLQDPSPPQRRKCVKFVQRPSAVANPVSTVEPSIAPTEIVISRKISFSVLLGNTQTLGSVTARYKDNGNNAPDSKCEPRERRGQEILPRASVG